MAHVPAIAIVGAALLAFLTITVTARRMTASMPGKRVPRYLAASAGGWALSGLVVTAIWYVDQGADTPDLGRALAETGVNLHHSVQDGLVACTWMFLTSVAASNLLLVLRRQFGGAPSIAALDLLPRSPGEVVVWSLVLAPSAGISEEFVYRGFVMSQIWMFSGNGWVAACASSILFGLAHAYQGTWGVLRTGVIGLVLAVGVLATWSIVPSIMAHILLNAFGVAFNPPLRRE